MNIAFDASDLATDRADGTTRYTRELLSRLPKLGSSHEWTAYSSGEFDLLLPDNTQKKISPWPKYWTQSRFLWELLRDKPDVLFMPIQQLPLFRRRGLKTVAVVHDLAFHVYPEQFTYKDWLLQHVFTAHVAHYADAIIAVSESTKRDIEKYYKRVKNVHVVHHGVDFKNFSISDPTQADMQDRKNLQEKYPDLKQNYILYVGQIQPRKNLPLLIRAFELIADTHPSMQLVIAGGHGWLQKSTREAIAHSLHKDRILTTGRVPDVLLPALYRQAKVFVLPSLYEGFGMPILEAMAAGTPVVTANVSSMPEVAGGAAVLFKPDSASDLVRALKDAFMRRDQLVAIGRQRVRKFSWDNTAKQTLTVIKSVI